MRFGSVVVLLLVFISINAKAQNREEFNGPFASWIDVKKQFGAKGNGKDDDTRAIQKAIDYLSNPVTNYNMEKGRFMVIYFPAGTYCISSTLVLKGKIGVSIIGQDPVTTIFRWTGPSKDTILWANGSAYYRISRFTWDANQRKDMEAIGIHWKDRWNDGKSMSFAALNIELTDHIFKGGFESGIHGGTSHPNGTGANDSEITIKRCVFDRCKAGIKIVGYNALDYWIWDCRFLQCGAGVNCAYGNYHVYRSYFTGSTQSDVINNNAYYTSVRGCYSTNSNGFSFDEGASCNPFKRIFQDNTVLNLKKFPIEYFHTGKVTLWQNRFGKVQDGNSQYVLHAGSWCPASYGVLSINNSFEVKEPFLIKQIALKKYQTDDRYGIAVKPFDFLKLLERTPSWQRRTVFEVPQQANSNTIQALIDKAARLAGTRPIIHFAAGVYNIDKPLVIPPNSDMQLIGDGLLYASVLNPTAAMVKDASVLIVKGPSYITVRDLQIGTSTSHNAGTAIRFENVDQPSAQSHLDQIYSQAEACLVTKGLNYLYIEKNNSFFSSGNYLEAGDLVSQKKGTARVCSYGGQFAKLQVSNGARFLAKDCWWEGNDRIPLQLKGAGEISIDGAMIAPVNADSLPTINISSFNGNISLVNMYLQGAIVVNPGTSSLNLLIWNVHSYHKMNVGELIKPGTKARIGLLGLNAQCFTNSPACKDIISIPDRVERISDVNGFLYTMTSFDRGSQPVPFTNLPAGTSNIYLSRISILPMAQAFVFTN